MRALLIAVLLVGCAKDDRTFDVKLTAACKFCAVEFTDEGVTHRDTVIGEIVSTWNDGVATLDTIASTGTYNLVCDEGDPVYFVACRLRTIDDGPITIRISTGSIEETATFPVACASINAAVHQ